MIEVPDNFEFELTDVCDAVGDDPLDVKPGDDLAGLIVAYVWEPGDPGYDSERKIVALITQTYVVSNVVYYEAYEASVLHKESIYSGFRLPTDHPETGGTPDGFICEKLIENKDAIGGFGPFNYWGGPAPGEAVPPWGWVFIMDFENDIVHKEYIDASQEPLAFARPIIIVDLWDPRSLYECFAFAKSAYFDPTYEIPKNRLRNFRNYSPQNA